MSVPTRSGSIWSISPSPSPDTNTLTQPPKIRKLHIVSWNVNSLRSMPSRINEKLQPLLKKFNADIICLQETKCTSFNDVTPEMALFDGYSSYWSFSREKRGWSGVVTYVRDTTPLVRVKEGFGDELFNKEGRVVMTDHRDFILFNIYFPNAGMGINRLNYKLAFYRSFEAHCKMLIQQGREIIVVGDVNTAHLDQDIHDSNIKRTGFLSEERSWMNDMINSQITAESLFEYRQDEEAELLGNSKKSVANGIVSFSNPMNNSISYCSTMEVRKGKELYMVPSIPPFIDSWRFFNRDLKRVFTFWDQYTQLIEETHTVGAIGTDRI